VESFTGKVAVVTGAASGIGRGLAQTFASEGMRVVAADLDEPRLAAVVAELQGQGVECFGHVTDVGDAEAIEALAAATYDRFGAAHVVCNNAGVSSYGRQWETSLEDWRWVLDACLWGVIHGIRSFVPRMLDAGEPGHVVNTASFGGLIGSAYLGPYSAAKHAVVGLSKGLRVELRDSSVDVSVLCPGEVRTSIFATTRARLEAATDGGLAPRQQKMFDLISGRLDTAGVEPADAAAMVVDAVRRQRFWVLPNVAAYVPLLRDEVEELLGSEPRG
jgi:NAD(P)-dependent dehydrogenase (short-subunit alcohol dehydrogenase family)